MVDILIVLLLFAGVYLGYKRGLIMQLFYLGTIIIGYLVSMLFSSRLAYLFTGLIPIPDNVSEGLNGIYQNCDSIDNSSFSFYFWINKKITFNKDNG